MPSSHGQDHWRSSDLKQGDLENLILNALWDMETTGQTRIFVGDVQEAIRQEDRRWAYTTVKTVLDRLVDKGLANRQKDGKRFFYQTILQRAEAAETALRKVLTQFFCDDMEQLLACVADLQQQGIGQGAEPLRLVSSDIIEDSHLEPRRRERNYVIEDKRAREMAYRRGLVNRTLGTNDSRPELVAAR